MSKKKKTQDTLAERLWKEVESQGFRLKDLISAFYPDGERAFFHKASHVGKLMLNSPSLDLLTEKHPMRAECIKLYNDAAVKESGITKISAYNASQHFMGTAYELGYRSFKVRIMLKAEQDDLPVYLKETYIEGNASAPLFLVDTNEKKAILIISDVVPPEDLKDFRKEDSLYAALSDLNVLLYDKDEKTGEQIAFMTSYSKADNRCYVEKVIDENMYLLDNLLISEPDDTPLSPKNESDEPVTKNDANE